MTTAHDYEALAGEVYAVDPLKKNPPLGTGATFTLASSGQEYLVVHADTNPVSGFQGMAVVPVVHGLPDYSQMIVSYAGTNPDHRADTLADVMEVVGGRSGSGTQVADALAFADAARAKAAKHNGGLPPSMSTTGHSLGAYLALLVAAEKHCGSTTFSGPVPWDRLTPQARAWMEAEFAAGRKPFTNYVSEYDLIGNFTRDTYGVNVYVKDTPLRGMFDYHDLEKAFRFDDGEVVGAGVRRRSDQEIMANLVNKDAPALSWLLAPALGSALDTLRHPGAGATAAQGVSALIVTVDTVAAMQMSSSILGVADSLRAIKSVNASLEERLQESLTGAMSAVNLFPFVTERDVLECVENHRLEVRHNLDLEAVADVDRLVDDHVETVFRLTTGIGQAVAHAMAQDMAWSQAYGGHGEGQRR